MQEDQIMMYMIENMIENRVARTVVHSQKVHLEKALKHTVRLIQPRIERGVERKVLLGTIRMQLRT